MFTEMFGKNFEIKSARRMGKHDASKHRDILVDMAHLEDNFFVLFNQANGVNTTPIKNFDTKLQNLAYEKVHTKFLKTILGVSKYTENSLVFGELGRYPISYKCLSLCAKYWHRMATGNSSNHLLSCAYQSEIDYNSNWIQRTQYILNINGLGYLWENPNLVSGAILYQKLKLRLTDQFIQSWFNTLASTDSLSVINTLKRTYGFSDYLTRVHSPQVRNTFTKLRFNERLLKNTRNIDGVTIAAWD